MKPRPALRNLSQSSPASPQDKRALIAPDSDGWGTDEMPRVMTTSRKRLLSAGHRRRRKWHEKGSSCYFFCLYLAVFGCGSLSTLLVIEVESDFVNLARWYNNCLRWADSGARAEVTAPSVSSAVCTNSCTFTLVESIPQNLTFTTGTMHTSTYAGLKMLLDSAQKSVNIASFYWSLRGQDIAFHDSTSNEGEDIFNSLLELGKSRKVAVQIVQNADNEDTSILAKEANAVVRTLNFTRLLGAGVLHTKFWIIDGQHFYIGSANLDWRSLTQVKELGVVVQNCPCLASDLQKVFEVYWYLGAPDATVPPQWPPQYNTSINMSSPITVPFNNTRAPVFISSSPPPFCPGGRSGDIDAITSVIQQAKSFVYIAVMDYSPSTEFLPHNKYWPIIDDALRSAAFDSHVNVRLLASNWSHTHKDMYTYLCSLMVLQDIKYPKVHIEVKLFEVPVYSKNQSHIPFARVNHNKYMVTDQHAYIGTSNWSADYFTDTAGVGFVVHQPRNDSLTEGNLRQQLFKVFERDWYSNYSHNLTCTFHHH